MTKALVICNIPSKGLSGGLMSLRLVLASVTLVIHIDKNGFVLKPSFITLGHKTVASDDIVRAYKNLDWNIVRGIEL